MLMFFGNRAESLVCSLEAPNFMDDGYAFDPKTLTWSEIDVQGAERPRARARATAAWDPGRRQLLLFGGFSHNRANGLEVALNDIWAFDTETRRWTELSPQSAGPGQPCGTGMTGPFGAVAVYEPANDRLLVMGGMCVSEDLLTTYVSNDVWAFNLFNNGWENLWNDPTSGAPARIFHAGALDTKRGRLYVFGGGQDVARGFDLRDMWYFDLAARNWVRTPRMATCTINAECGGSPCLIGPDSQTPGGQLGLCGTPRARVDHVMAYDEGRDQVVLFAGRDNAALGTVNDLWTFDPETEEWNLRVLGDEFNKPAVAYCEFPADFATVDLGAPERRRSHLFVVARDRAIMYGGRSDCGLVDDTWILNVNDYRWMEVIPSSSGMTCLRSGRADCAQPNARMCW